MPPHMPLTRLPQEILNGIYEGFKWHNLVDGDKGQFAAIYAESAEANCGLPFWLGRIAAIDRERDPREDQEELDDEDEEEDTYEAVQIADWYQVRNSAAADGANGTGKYAAHKVDGAPKKGSKRTTATQVHTWVPASQVAYVFPKLLASGKIAKADLSWIAHHCEIAWKTRSVAVHGVEAFNTSLGHVTLPIPPPPT